MRADLPGSHHTCRAPGRRSLSAACHRSGSRRWWAWAPGPPLAGLGPSQQEAPPRRARYRAWRGFAPRGPAARRGPDRGSRATGRPRSPAWHPPEQPSPERPGPRTGPMAAREPAFLPSHRRGPRMTRRRARDAARREQPPAWEGDPRKARAARDAAWREQPPAWDGERRKARAARDAARREQPPAWEGDRRKARAARDAARRPSAAGRPWAEASRDRRGRRKGRRELGCRARRLGRERGGRAPRAAAWEPARQQRARPWERAGRVAGAGSGDTARERPWR